MSDAAITLDHGERIARLEQIADESKLGDRLDQKIDALGTRLDQKIDALGTRLDRRIDSLTKWLVGLLFTLTIAMLGGFAALHQVIARLPHS